MTENNSKPTPEEEIKEICNLIVKSQDPDLVFDFFGCLFTKSEMSDFSKRWSLVKELRAGTTQREIAKKYNISLCNITRGSRELKKEDSAFHKMLALLDDAQSQTTRQTGGLHTAYKAGSQAASQDAGFH